jgi:DNA-binding response OmpR family regulator
MVSPSCPALVIHEDDAFRKSLIATLDQKHFTVTVVADGSGAVAQLKSRSFQVVILGIDVAKRTGMETLQHLRANRATIDARIIVVGEPSPTLREYAGVADETLLRPVDASYVADRARTYCRH